MKSLADPLTNVSRETQERLEAFAALLLKWTPSINLIAKSTWPDIWQRHIRDSAQLASFVGDDTHTWLDVGSGGGLPALVLAILFAETRRDIQVVLVESDQRKSAFLRTAIRELELTAQVKTERVEDVASLKADILSARAFAPLPKLLDLTQPHLSPDGRMVLMKGAQYQRELEESLASWTFQSEVWSSLTHPQSVILELWDIAPI